MSLEFRAPGNRGVDQGAGLGHVAREAEEGATLVLGGDRRQHSEVRARTPRRRVPYCRSLLRLLSVAAVRFGGLAVRRTGSLQPVLRPLGPPRTGPAECRRLGGCTQSGAESAESQPGPVRAQDGARLERASRQPRRLSRNGGSVALLESGLRLLPGNPGRAEGLGRGVTPRRADVARHLNRGRRREPSVEATFPRPARRGLHPGTHVRSARHTHGGTGRRGRHHHLRRHLGSTGHPHAPALAPAFEPGSGQADLACASKGRHHLVDKRPLHASPWTMASGRFGLPTPSTTPYPDSDSRRQGNSRNQYWFDPRINGDEHKDATRDG